MAIRILAATISIGASSNWLLTICPRSIRNERHIWNSARRLAEDAKKKLSSSEETELILEIPTG